jgi:hypothetical protein
MKSRDRPLVTLAIGFLVGNQFIVVDEVGGQHIVYGIQIPLDSCLHETAGMAMFSSTGIEVLLLANSRFVQRVGTSMMPAEQARRILPKTYSPECVEGKLSEVSQGMVHLGDALRLRRLAS